MATQTVSSADAILKELYVGPIVEQLNQKCFMLEQIERDSDHVDHTGRRAIVPVHSGRNRGRGSTADGGTLPTAGRQAWADAIVAIRYHYYGIELSDGIMEASRSNEGAFVSALTAETKGVATDMKKDLNRQVFGDGTGLLATATSAAAGVVTLQSGSTPQYIQVGDVVDLLVISTGATTDGVVSSTVTARSTGSNTVTISPAPATPANINTTYGFYIAGNRNNEMDGLQNITGTGRTLHSINSSTAGNEYWNGNTRSVGASAAAPAVAGETHFEQLFDDVGILGTDIEACLTTRGIKRRLADQYQSQKRFNDANAVNVHGGYSAIMVNETPIIADDDAPKQWAFAFKKDAFKWFEQTKPGWLEHDSGGIFHLKVAAAGSFSSNWQAWFRWYAALGCIRPNSTARLRFCTDDTTV